MSDKEPDTTPSAERVAYRDAGEFNKAMDRAADAIRAERRIARCPECGGEFAIAQYERPAQKASS